MAETAALRAWHSADRRYETASRAACQCAHAYLLAGRVVKWAHGDNVRIATVLNTSGSWNYDHLRVKVRGESGREYWIYASAILNWETRHG